jgi:putative transposase
MAQVVTRPSTRASGRQPSASPELELKLARVSQAGPISMTFHGEEQWRLPRWTISWRAHHHTGGTGHLYQGRFKAFPVQSDEHLLTVLRYVERNAVRANLVKRAEDWRWSSAWRRTQGDGELKSLVSDSPIDSPPDWPARVDRPMTDQELEAIRHCVTRGTPFGGERWRKKTAARLALTHTLRPRGRPRKLKK